MPCLRANWEPTQIVKSIPHIFNNCQGFLPHFFALPGGDSHSIATCADIYEDLHQNHDNRYNRAEELMPPPQGQAVPDRWIRLHCQLLRPLLLQARVRGAIGTE